MLSLSIYEDTLPEAPGSPAASVTGNSPPPGLLVLCMGMALGTRLREGQG